MTSYKTSGVNINNADKFVDRIKPLVIKTFNKSVISGIGNFGAFYEIDLKKYKNPVFVSSTDGVGTKVKIASMFNKYDTVGEDLINHCVNDIAVCGATPLFFLDYYATGKLKVENAVNIVKGLIKGCRANSLSLIGGETAEMPGVYSENEFDLAGTIVGIVEKKKILNSNSVKKGDILIGFQSNGLHTNGYSLVRKIFSKNELSKMYKGNKTLNSELLRAHKSYLKIIQTSLTNFNIKSFSHITGGGIIGNTKRVIPKELSLKIFWDNWKRPEIFKLIQKRGNVSEKDMQQTFNLGIGLIAIISKKSGEEFIEFWNQRNEICKIVGEVI